MPLRFAYVIFTPQLYTAIHSGQVYPEFTERVQNCATGICNWSLTYGKYPPAVEPQDVAALRNIGKNMTAILLQNCAETGSRLQHSADTNI